MLTRVAARLAQRQPVRIVLYGDSISEVGRTPGWHGGASCPAQNWGRQLRGLLAKAFPGQQFIARNFGIGGQNAYEGLGRMDGLRPLAPDLVLIAFGANDCGWHPLQPQETATAIGHMIEAIRVIYGADVVVVGPGGENPLDYGMEHFAETCAAIRQVAEEKAVPFVDTRTAMLAATHAGDCWEEYHRGHRDCHPNDRGHAVWAAAACAVILHELQVEVTA